MYLRTPKRYKRPGRRHNLIKWRWLPLWIITPIIVVVGMRIYENREQIQPEVDRFLNDLFTDAGDMLDEVNAPPPTPTPDPTSKLVDADDSWSRGAIQSAVETYQEVLERTPNDVLVHYRLALGLIMQGRLEDALVAAEHAVTAWPYSPDAWSIRAMVLNRLDRSGEAIASALRALQLVPESMVQSEPVMAVSRARALAFLAEAYLETDQADRALATVEEAIELNPNGFEAYQVRGQIYQVAYFDFASALADFETAHDLAPNMIYVTIWLARLLKRSDFDYQDYDRAIELFQSIIDQNYENTLALFDLGDYYYRVEGNLAEATKYLSSCIEADPLDADCHYMLGRTRMRELNVSNAQTALQTAYDLDPEDAYKIWWLAQSYIQLGQCPQALPYLQSGYQIAQADQNEGLIGDYEVSLEECRAPVPSEVTPEADASGT